jgi:hypothetical protein
MPDATECWLVEIEEESGSRYEHVAGHDEVTAFLRELVQRGETVILYQRVPFEVQIGVTVKAPRKRRKTPPSADKPDPAPPPTGPGNGEAGEPEGAAGPDAQDVNGADTSGAPAPLPNTAGTSNPASPFSCEARFDGDPSCSGHVERDPVTGGWFCALHMQCIPLSGRAEYHRRHASRNRPVRVAHAG